MTIDDPENAQRAERLTTILSQLKDEGLKQSLVANELNIPSNYLVLQRQVTHQDSGIGWFC